MLISSLSFNIIPVGVFFFASVKFNTFLSYIDILSISEILSSISAFVCIPKSVDIFDNSPMVLSISFFASVSESLLGNNALSKFLASLILLLI